MSLAARPARQMLRRVVASPAFQAQMERQRRADPYLRAARQLAYSAMTDQQARDALRDRVARDDVGLGAAVQQSAVNRANFLSDREFRLLLAVTANAAVRPIDLKLAGLFAEEENLGRLPLRAAFERLAVLEPGLRELEASKVSDLRTRAEIQHDRHSLRREHDLVGIAARSGLSLLRSDISASITRQYLAINAGRIQGDVDVPYFDRQQVGTSSGFFFGGPRRPNAGN